MPRGKGKGKGAVVAEDDTKLKVANQLKLRHILCEKASKSNEALEELKKGTSFNVAAEKYSEDKARTGGNLGWMVRNGMMGCFQENAFSIPVSTCAAPIYKVIKSQHGYHIVMVEDRK
ncbi:hypothetical protein JCM8208_001439 [Rhodotorula glutinis]